MIFKIEDRIIFATLHGSHAYGMAKEGSDVDIKGVAIPPKSYFLGFNDSFQQFEGEVPRDFHLFDDKYVLTGETYIQKIEDMVGRKIPKEEKLDSTIYDIRKFFKLASVCNPNIIEVLFTDPSHHVVSSVAWKKILEHKDLFISARAKFTFSGYAFSQLKRIKTHKSWLMNPLERKPQRSDFDLPEQHVIPKEQRDAANAFIVKRVNEWIFIPDEIPKDILISVREQTAKAIREIWEGMAMKSYVLEDGNYIPMVPPLGEMNEYDEGVLYNAAGNFLGYSTNFLEVLERERKYKAALRQYNQYQEWKKNRNPVRAEMEKKYGFDVKHGAHLVRLLRMAKEILVEGKVIVKRPDAEELLSIRGGAWTYDQLIEWADKQQEEINNIYDNKKYVVPRVPKINDLNDLCQDVVEMVL